MSNRAVGVACAALLLISHLGCETKTSVTSVYAAEVPAAARSMRKLVVVGARMDAANRRVLEDSFTAELARHGVQAVQAYKVMPEDPLDRERAKRAVQDASADGILVATMKGIREEVTYVPGTYSYGTGAWVGYYGNNYSGFNYNGGEYGYLRSDELVRVEITLWDARNSDTVLWSALTTTANPSSGRDFVKSVTETVIPELARGGFIPPAPKK